MNKEQKHVLYDENKNLPTDKLGVCPVCGSKNNKIFFGRPDNQDMICDNGHLWEHGTRNVIQAEPEGENDGKRACKKSRI